MPNLKALLLVLALLGASLGLNLRLRHLDDAWVQPPEAARPVNPWMLRLFSPGFLPATLDWIWLQCLADSAIDRVPQGYHPQLYHRLILLAGIDPAFRDVYTAGSSILAVIRHDGQGAYDVLERGVRYVRETLPSMPAAFTERFWKNAWEVGVLMGYVHLFELNDVPQAQAAFELAARFPDAPPYLKNLSQRLDTPDGQIDVGFRIIGMLAKTTKDERAKEALEEKRRDLQLVQFLRQANADFAQFRARHQTRGRNIPDAELFARFIQTRPSGEVDPHGGHLLLRTDGRIATTSPHQPVFGLSAD